MMGQGDLVQKSTWGENQRAWPLLDGHGLKMSSYVFVLGAEAPGWNQPWDLLGQAHMEGGR